MSSRSRAIRSACHFVARAISRVYRVKLSADAIPDARAATPRVIRLSPITTTKWAYNRDADRRRDANPRISDVVVRVDRIRRRRAHPSSLHICQSLYVPLFWNVASARRDSYYRRSRAYVLVCIFCARTSAREERIPQSTLAELSRTSRLIHSSAVRCFTEMRIPTRAAPRPPGSQSATRRDPIWSSRLVLPLVKEEMPVTSSLRRTLLPSCLSLLQR